MNVRKITLAAASLCLLATACKKDDAPNNDATSFTMYKPGNYWIYQSYIVDESGNGAPGSSNAGNPSLYDSVYVEKDTPINGYTYHKLMKPDYVGSPTYQTTFLRDSLNYEVDFAGHILLAPDDFSTTLRTVNVDPGIISRDSALIMQVRMADKNKIVSVPAGSFPTISLDKVWNSYPFAGQNQQYSQRRQHWRYAGGIGMITETMDFYFSIPTYEERRLVRYSVK